MFGFVNFLHRTASNFKWPNITFQLVLHYAILLAFFYSLPAQSISSSSPNTCTRTEEYQVEVPTKITTPVIVERTKFCMKNIKFRCKEKRTEYRTQLIIQTENRTRIIVECCPGYELVDERCVEPDPCRKKACTTSTTTTTTTTTNPTTITTDYYYETTGSANSNYELSEATAKTINFFADSSSSLTPTTVSTTMTEMNLDRSTTEMNSDPSTTEMNLDRSTTEMNLDRSTTEMNLDRSTTEMNLDRSTTEMNLDRSTATTTDTSLATTTLDINTSGSINSISDLISSPTDTPSYYVSSSSSSSPVAKKNLIRKILPLNFKKKFSPHTRGASLESATLDELVKAAVDKCLLYGKEEKLNDTLVRVCNTILTLDDMIDTDNNDYNNNNNRDQTTDNIILASSESVNGSVLQNANGVIILEDHTSRNDPPPSGSISSIDSSDNDSSGGRQIAKGSTTEATINYHDELNKTTIENDIISSSSSAIVVNTTAPCNQCKWSVNASSGNDANFLWIWMVIIVSLILLVACNTVIFALVRYYKKRHQSRKLKIPLDFIDI